ncbi:MAG: hypothetical protein LBJ47_07995 [Tannerella sp.]|jgi:hypothetical protein|nr:hypothetical protein [Tannerella sp.]
MRNIANICLLAAIFPASCGHEAGNGTDEITVACYYFPDYHTRDTTGLPISRQHYHFGLPQVQTDYNLVRDRYMEHWERVEKEYPVPYYPNVTTGWDSSPRTNRNGECCGNEGCLRHGKRL